MEPASLTLADLDRLGTCSSTVIGLAMLEQTDQTAVLGMRDGQALLTQVQQEGARPQLPYTTGLYHIPILLSSWVDLALHAGIKPPVGEV
jgi:catechol-2,3-dioxygenase